MTHPELTAPSSPLTTEYVDSFREPHSHTTTSDITIAASPKYCHSVDSASASVAVIDDHELVARSLADVLTNWGFTAVPLSCGNLQLEELVDLIDHGWWWGDRSRIALVDVNLRDDLDGVRLVRPLHQRGISVAILTGVDDRLRLASAVAAGAQGLVSKGQPLDDLHRTVELLARGQPAIPLAERCAILDWFSAERRRIKPLLDHLATLTKAEAVVLAELCQGLTVDEIAVGHVVAVATVRSQVHSILMKLGLHAQRDAVRLARVARWPESRTVLFD